MYVCIVINLDILNNKIQKLKNYRYFCKKSIDIYWHYFFIAYDKFFWENKY